MEIHTRKIAIIGAGHVGSHAGYALLSQGLAEEIVYIDIDERKPGRRLLTCMIPRYICQREHWFTREITATSRMHSS